MELNEAIQRIIRRHWKLIALFALLGLTVGVVVPRNATTYTASTRVVLNVPDPTTVSGAAAVADTARAIVTSPQVVMEALQAAGLSEDPISFARHNIAVSSLGSSGIVLISVKDASPGAAAVVANQLSTALVNARQNGGESAALEQINNNLAVLGSHISNLDNRIARLSATVARSVPGSAAQIQLDQLTAKHNSLALQQVGAESERTSLIVASASSPQAAVVARAEQPVVPDPSVRILNATLGLLIGLILGFGLAAGVETVRPTVVGGRAAAHLLGVPLLGSIRSNGNGSFHGLPLLGSTRSNGNGSFDGVPLLGSIRSNGNGSFHGLPLLGSIRSNGNGSFDPTSAAHRIRIAAASANKQVVELVPAKESMDLAPLASQLRTALNAGRAQSPALRIFDGVTRAREGVGLVLVTPHSIKRQELDLAVDLLSLAKEPLLGVLTVRGSVHDKAQSTDAIAESVPS